MADDTTRIINLTEATEVSDGMYLVTDASTGTRKLSLQKVLDKVGGNVADDYDATATYEVGDLCVYKGVLYECSTEISTAEAWNSNHWSRINLGDIVADIDRSIDALNEDKANKSGEYDNIVAGTAKQLLSTQMVEDQTPYLFRTSGGSTDIGNREYLRKLVGGTFAWNQAVTQAMQAETKNGITFTNNNDGTWTVSGTATADALKAMSVGFFPPENHVVLAWGCPSGGSDSTYYLDTGRTRHDTGNGLIAKTQSTLPVRLVIREGATVNNLKFVPQAIDLTTLFGSTIADYVYSLEQATAGSGVAWLKKYFPNLFEYHEYSEPTLKSVEGLVSHDMVGFNQIKPIAPIRGTYNASVGDTLSTTSPTATVSGENPITVTANVAWAGCCFVSDKLIGGLQYEFLAKVSGAGARTSLYLIDENYKVVFKEANYSDSYTIRPKITPGRDGLRFALAVASNVGGTVTVEGLCVHLVWSGTRDGEYEPYEKHSYPLDSSITLRGIPKLDANNQIYYDGDEYESDGTVTRKYGIVDLGNLTYTQSSSGLFQTESLASLIKHPSTASVKTESVIGAGYVEIASNDIIGPSGTNPSPNMVMAVNVGGRLYFNNTSYTDAATFKAAMSGVYLVYELATHTTETADPYQSPQIVDDFGTEEFVTTGLVPVGNVTEYPANLRDKLQHLPDLADGDGYYLVQQDGTQMALVAFHIPKATGLADGTYTLKATVSGGTPTYTWESES